MTGSNKIGTPAGVNKIPRAQQDEVKDMPATAAWLSGATPTQRQDGPEVWQPREESRGAIGNREEVWQPREENRGVGASTEEVWQPREENRGVGASTEEAATPAPARSTYSVSPSCCPGQLEPWQEKDADGAIMCKACNKFCDGVHEHTAEHQRKVEFFSWALQAENQDYTDPSQEWLAWVPDDQYGPGRYLKCLLCQKWVQDYYGTTTEDYHGHHGWPGPGNQKNHGKKVRNIDHSCSLSLYEEKCKWHPKARRSAGLESPATLPSGWRKAWSEEHKHWYYYNGEVVTWDMP